MAYRTVIYHNGKIPLISQAYDKIAKADLIAPFDVNPTYWYKFDAGKTSSNTALKNTVNSNGQMTLAFNFANIALSNTDMVPNGTTAFGTYVTASTSYIKGDSQNGYKVTGASNADYSYNTMFAVLELSTLTTADIVNFNNNAGGAFVGISIKNGGIVYSNNLNNSTPSSYLGYTASTGVTYLISGNIDGLNKYFNINGQNITTTFSNYIATDDATQVLKGKFSDINMKEIVIFNSSLNATQIQNWQDYLKSKWNISY